MTVSAKIGITHMAEGQSGGEILYNEGANRLDAMVHLKIEDRDLTAPPGGEADGEVWLVKSTATGAWDTHDDELAIYVSGWTFVTPTEGMIARVLDENVLIQYDGTAWVEMMTTAAAITASASQNQGQQPLTNEINQVTVVGTDNDVVTLPSVASGKRCVVINRDAAQILQVYPASGDKIQGASLNASVTIAAGNRLILYGVSATEWE